MRTLTRRASIVQRQREALEPDPGVGGGEAPLDGRPGGVAAGSVSRSKAERWASRGRAPLVFGGSFGKSGTMATQRTSGASWALMAGKKYAPITNYATHSKESNVTDQASTQPSPSKQGERTFVVGLRASTGLYFPNDDTLTINGFPAAEVGLIDIVFRMNRLSAEGFSHPIRVGLWIDVSGAAPSMSAAVEAFGNVARGMTAILSVAANAGIEDPTADMAYETTEGNSQREYWSRNAPEFEFPSGFGRAIIPQLPAVLIRAYAQHPEQDRFHRAIVQYHHALQNWVPGSEIASLTHVWVGMEALTKIVRSQLMSNLGLSTDKLRTHFSALLSSETGKKVELRGFNDLDGEIRRRHLFQGDDATYKLAKDASDGYEHSFDPLWQVRDQAVQALEPAAAYLRRGILDYSGIDADAKNVLLHEYFRLPFDVTLWSSLTGELTGTPEALDGMDYYPDIQWASEPFQRGIDEEGDAQVGFGTRIVSANLPLGVAFKPTGMDIYTSPAMAQGTAVLAGKSRSALSDQGPSTPWKDVTGGGRVASSIRISDVFDQSIRTDGERAISFDAQCEYRVESIRMSETGIDPEDMLRSAEKLRATRASDGWELLCALPQSEDSVLRLVFRRIIPES